MTYPVDLFWSFRSPYSHLALPRLIALQSERPIEIRVRPVRPLALRQPDFFEREDPNWMGYLLTDVLRLSDYLGVPIALPDPDPVAMDESRKRALPEQPHIHRLTRIGAAAAEAGDGLTALYALSSRIWSGERWETREQLVAALDEAGLDGERLVETAECEAERLDAVIAENELALNAAGHWGVPTLVYKNEPFFGQDRIDLLVWRLEQDGLQPAAETV